MLGNSIQFPCCAPKLIQQFYSGARGQGYAIAECTQTSTPSCLPRTLPRIPEALLWTTALKHADKRVCACVERFRLWPNSGMLYPGSTCTDQPQSKGASSSAEFVPQTGEKKEKEKKKKGKNNLQNQYKILSGAEHLVSSPKSMEKGLVVHQPGL